MSQPFDKTVRINWSMRMILFLWAVLFFVLGVRLLSALFSDFSWPIFGLFCICVFMVYVGIANALASVRVTETSITLTGMFGRYRIHWDDVWRVIVNERGLCFMGSNKWLSLSLVYVGKGKLETISYIDYQIERRQISVEVNQKMPLVQRNTRVWP